MTRSIAIAMALSVLVLAAACGSTETDTPEVAAKKAQCRALEAHVFRISPQAAAQFAGLAEADAQKLADSMVAQLPLEDIQECVAAKPAVIACIQAAANVAAVKTCIRDGVH